MELPLDFGGHIGDAAVGKVLAHEEKAGKLHGFMVAKVSAGAGRVLRELFPRLRPWLEGRQRIVGRSPWTAADALVGLSRPLIKGLIPQAESGSRGTRADQGIGVKIRIEVFGVMA
jgi:hypothetical protein